MLVGFLHVTEVILFLSLDVYIIYTYIEHKCVGQTNLFHLPRKLHISPYKTFAFVYPMKENNMSNINPYILDYMNTPLVNNIPTLFDQCPSSSSSSLVLPQLPVTMVHHLDDNISNNNISLERSNAVWVSLLYGFMNGDHKGSMMERELHEGDEKNRGRNCKCMKNGRGKKVTPSRVAFHTRSIEEILDDGYKWRKYGQKSVKNSHHPRSYYRCTHHTCDVKKQIQRLSKDNSIVVTTYEGIHDHPCEKFMETLTPLLKQLQFLSRF